MKTRLALRRDGDAVAAALADAFIDDPLMVWLSGIDDPETRRRVMQAAMFAPGAAAAQRTGHGHLVEDDHGRTVGAALWNPPDTNFFSAADGELIGTALGQGAGPEAVARVRELSAMLHGHHFPERTYFHLQFLGVAGAERSRGVGALLVAPVLRRCDEDGLPAALESSNPRNVSFYRRQGFEVVWTDAPDGGPPMQGMWREPRPVGASEDT